MLKLKQERRYPGAFYVGADPVTEVECCLAQSVQLLAAACVSLGVAYSIAEGKIYMEITTPDLLDECQGEAPTITGVESNDLENGVANSLECTEAGAVEGELWVGNTASYEGSQTLVQQTVTSWTDTDIEFTAVQGGFGLSPPPAYLFVVNSCGRPNLVGEMIAWVAA